SHLFDSDTMLAGEAATHRDACLQDIAARINCTSYLRGVAFVVHYNRMDIAIPGVEDIAYLQLVATADLRDLTQDGRQFGARYYTVLRRIIRSEAPNRAECTLARLPQRGAFIFV